MINDIRPDCETLRHVVTVRTDAKGEGESSLADLVSGDEIPDESVLGPVPDADDPHAIIYTSGTESRPKGCFHTFNTFGYPVYSLGDDVMGLNPDDVMFMPSPVTHATGLAMGVTTPIVLGCGMHLMDTWEPKAALGRIREHGCTASVAATPFVRMVLDNYHPDRHDLSSLRVWVSAGAPIPAALLSEWKPKFPDCVLVAVYGRSEGLLVASCRLDDPQEKILGSDGRALPGVDLRIQTKRATRSPPAWRARSATAGRA